MKRDFISLSDFSQHELQAMIDLASRIKYGNMPEYFPLRDKHAALIFEKPSLRTHVSFDIGIAELGGHSVYLSQQHVGLATRESIRDVAEVLSTYVDLIVARTMSHATVEGLAAYSTVPVINALTDLSHPCQIMADVFTLTELNLFSDRTKITFIGDGNNVVNSWLEFAEKFPIHFVLGCPPGYEPNKQILDRTIRAGVSKIEIVHDPLVAAHNANVLYTDVWISMGQDQELAARQKAFQRYRIDRELLRVAAADCIVMHCLPAHRGEEISADVLEGPQSIVIRQAENRLHMQKGILAFLFEGEHSFSERTSELAEQV